MVHTAKAGVKLLERNVVEEVRLITEADLPWASYLIRKRYSKERYDWYSGEGWFRNTVLKQPLIFQPTRTTNAFCISMLSLQPWVPSETECHVVFICCDDGAMWEGMRLLRASAEWAKMRNCKCWKLSSDTEYDLKMLALRMGCTEQTPRYVLRFY